MDRFRVFSYGPFLLLIWLVWAFDTSVKGSFTLSEKDKTCSNAASTCSECIAQPDCKWCAKSKTPNGSEHHCFSIDTELSDICHSDSVENPRNAFLEKIRDDPLSESKSKIRTHAEIVQLRPQHVKVKLRKGQPLNITVSFRQVEDYPLDLYYLMDLSRSMFKDKKTLGKLGKKLANAMRNLTSQFKIGFGSFVDKVMLPFVNIHPSHLKQPCSKINCATPFSFKNNLKLNENDTEFTIKVDTAQISSNLDSPEGGFDALMQAMVCKTQIGWRENVRKILIFSTDALFHIAGDGKLAGVIRPNDGKCHMADDENYTKYDEYDYPSISQINEVAQSKGINIIFAVKRHEKVYKKLSERIKGSNFGKLDESSTNVINLVIDIYKSITSKVIMEVKDKGRDNPLSARFFSDCGKSGEMELTNSCSDIKEGNTFDFIVELTVTECPKDLKRASLTVGTLQESLQVDVELLCDCDCEQPDHPGYERNAKSCSSHGTKQCEICSCDPGYYGKMCKCSTSGTMTTNNFQSDQSKCRPEGSNSTDPVCNRRGACECETCVCWKKRHHGRFCQCDQQRCVQHMDSSVECSGYGRCSCNRCECRPGREGEFCECQSQKNCIAEESKRPCSDNGECICGKCECSIPYTGKYCEECPTCGKGKCLDFRPCVQCQVWQSGPLMGEDCKSCNISKIQTLPSLDAQLRQYALLCTFLDESTGCDFNFTYKYIEEGYHEIFGQNEQKCPQKINILAAIFGVIGGIVAIGVLTLIVWKILTTIHDRREYERFEKESRNPQWNTECNPMYTPATTTIANPAFNVKG